MHYISELLSPLHNKLRSKIAWQCSEAITSKSGYPELFPGKDGVLKICSKFTGEHPCQSTISIKLIYNFIEITIRQECSPVNLLHISRTSFLKNTSGWLVLSHRYGVIYCHFWDIIQSCIKNPVMHVKWKLFTKIFN